MLYQYELCFGINFSVYWVKIAYQVLIYNPAQIQSLNTLEPSCCQNSKDWDMIQSKSTNLACVGLSTLPSIAQTKQRMHTDDHKQSLLLLRGTLDAS